MENHVKAGTQTSSEKQQYRRVTDQMKTRFFQFIESGISVNKAAAICGIGRTNGKKIYKKLKEEKNKQPFVKQQYTPQDQNPKTASEKNVAEVPSSFWVPSPLSFLASLLLFFMNAWPPLESQYLNFTPPQ